MAEGALTTATAAASAGLNVNRQPLGDAGFLFLDLNGTQVKAMADVRVRRALNYAVDRRTICSALYGEFGRPSTTGLSTNDASLPKGQSFYNYQPGLARTLLAQAGYANGFTMPTLVYVPLAGTEIGQAVARYLQDVGVKLDLTNDTSAATFIAHQASKQFPFQTNTLGLRSMYQDFILTWKPGGVVNPYGYADPELAKLYNRAIRARDPQPSLNQMVGRITDRAYSLNVCRNSLFFYSSKRVGGIATNALATQPFMSAVFPK
jgi:peptide/nickel transport system substrate-binding protein